MKSMPVLLISQVAYATHRGRQPPRQMLAHGAGAGDSRFSGERSWSAGRCSQRLLRDDVGPARFADPFLGPQELPPFCRHKSWDDG